MTPEIFAEMYAATEPSAFYELADTLSNAEYAEYVRYASHRAVADAASQVRPSLLMRSTQVTEDIRRRT